jgi:hypothetical protein
MLQGLFPAPADDKGGYDIELKKGEIIIWTPFPWTVTVSIRVFFTITIEILYEDKPPKKIKEKIRSPGLARRRTVSSDGTTYVDAKNSKGEWGGALRRERDKKQNKRTRTSDVPKGRDRLHRHPREGAEKRPQREDQGLEIHRDL